MAFRIRRTATAAALVVSVLGTSARAATVVALPSAADAEVPVAIRINGVAGEDTVALRAENGDWCFSATDLHAWTVRVLDAGIRSYGNQTYHCLGALAGSDVRLDAASLTLFVTLPTSAFEGSVAEVYHEPVRTDVAPIGVGGFINYDLLASQFGSSPGSTDSLFFGGFAETVVYSPFGSLESSFVARNLGDVSVNQPGQGRGFARLETFLRKDFPGRLATLTVGDAIGTSGYWGRPTRFAGVRYARNFETRPGFVTTPQLSFNGEAALPSVVDVFINDSRVQTLNVPSGPFAITNIPSFANVGEARVVVTDLLGRQSLISLPFLTSPQQLRAGLSSFSWEAGVTRKTFGRSRDHYGGGQAVAQYGYGWSDTLSSELRGEWSNGVRALGLSSSAVLSPLGIISSTAVVSESRAGIGTLGVLSYSRPSIGGLNLTASAQRASRDFRQIGLLQTSTPRASSDVRQTSFATTQTQPQWLLVASLTQRFWRTWNANIGYVRQSYYDRRGVEIVSLSAGTVWQGWSVGASAAARHERVDSQIYSLSVSRSLGGKVNASSSLRLRESDDEENRDVRIQVQRSLPEGEGYGWRVLAGAAQNDSGIDAERGLSTSERYELGAAARTSMATFTADIGRANGFDASRAGVSGAFGLIESTAFASRSITRSFGIVQAPELAGLALSVNGQRTATVDQSGYALIPQLIPYAPNLISVDLDQAPLDLFIDQPRLRLTPGNRTGHKVDFRARRLRAATLRLLMPNGRPVPAGAEIEVMGTPERFAVADDGEAYLTAAGSVAELRVVWADRTCRASLDLPSVEITATLGNVRCETSP